MKIRPKYIAAAVGVTALTALAAAPALAVSRPSDGRIVFTGNPTGNYDIYTMNTRGGDMVRLTDSAVGDFHAQWSPDGTKIVFERFDATGGADIWLMNRDGSRQVQLTHGPFDAQPAWSPDGRRIAFWRDLGDGEDLYTMRANGTDIRQVTDLPEGEAFPRYSPDGTTFAYTRRLGPDFSGFSVHLIRIDGTRDRQLTPTSMEAANADWSPDGTRLAFNNNNDQNAESCTAASDIFVMRPTGGPIANVTSHFGCNSFPSWSPDARKLLFDHVDAPFTGLSDIYVMNADGSERINLTHTPNVDELLADWSAS
jgi:Tol biopolymer transport system component